MTQPTRKKKIAARNQAEAKKFWMTVMIITAVLLALLFIIYYRTVS